MSATQGFVAITENGEFVVEHANLGHLGTRTEYSVTDVLNHATLFMVAPKKCPFKVTLLPAYSTRVVRIGQLENTFSPDSDKD